MNALRRVILSAGQRKHYKVDHAKVRLYSRRDKKTEQEEGQDLGFFQYEVYELLPIGKIHPEKVWKEIKLKQVQKDIENNKPLGPIRVIKKGGLYHITDGIHRYNASVLAGYTHIPAMIQHKVKVKKKSPTVQKSKPKLKKLDWVVLKSPPYGHSKWAQINEYRSENEEFGKLYNLVGLEGDQAAALGDIRDSEFDLAKSKPPAEVQKALKDSFWFS